MNKKGFLFLFLISIGSLLNAQIIQGVVKVQRSNGDLQPLAYASIFWVEGNTAFVSAADGSFSFNRNNKEIVSLISSFVGYTKDTVILKSDENHAEFHLKENSILNEVRITGKQQGNYLSKTASLKTEVITSAGLGKMACCNLAESFENSASVTVGYSDAITGARQIRLLGLSGQYTQMLDENRPVMRGIASPFGLSYIPGQWLESIQIAKGPSSVVNGLEAITGQINLEHRKPTTEQPFFLNLFLSNTLRSEVNVASSLQLNSKLSTVIMGHFSTDPMGHDGNKDGFMDEPITMQFNLANRWLYVSKSGVQVRFGFKALSDDRLGGQENFKKDSPRDFTIWGSSIKNKGVNTYLKVGIPLIADNSKNIAGVIDYTYHQMNSFFGIKDYNGRQNSVFMNFMFLNIINKNHKYILGLSSQYDHFNELLSTHSSYYAPTFIALLALPSYDPSREEISFGAYGEYTYTNGEKLTLVSGLRLDKNNLHGWLFAPRVNIKYAFTDKLVFRASGGRGFRSSNVIADNLGMLSTGRNIKVDSNLDMEDAWTYGANITGYFPLGFDKDASLSFDYFRTDFNKQIIVDQERDINSVWLYNLDGRSFTNTYQFDFSMEPLQRFTVLATFRYTDAKVTLHGQGLVIKPLTSKYKGVLNFRYATRMNIWTFDFTTQINGPSKLYWFSDMEQSPVYTILYAQITRKFRNLEVYVGGENLTDYRQKNPIIDAKNPYATDFNSTVIWGPLMGIKIYAGLRFTIWK